MLFKPFGQDRWWHIARRIHPDRLEQLWEHSQGEFSPQTIIAFENYLNKIRHCKECKELIQNGVRV